MMMTATTHFLGNRAEGMWKEGESKEVDADRAAKLLKAGLVKEKETGETEAAKVAKVSPAPAPAKRETKPAKVKLETK